MALEAPRLSTALDARVLPAGNGLLHGQLHLHKAGRAVARLQQHATLTAKLLRNFLQPLSAHLFNLAQAGRRGRGRGRGSERGRGVNGPPLMPPKHAGLYTACHPNTGSHPNTKQPLRQGGAGGRAEGTADKQVGQGRAGPGRSAWEGGFDSPLSTQAHFNKACFLPSHAPPTQRPCPPYPQRVLYALWWSTRGGDPVHAPPCPPVPPVGPLCTLVVHARSRSSGGCPAPPGRTASGAAHARPRAARPW